MGLLVDRAKAAARFAEALAIARSDEGVPEEWVGYTERLNEAKKSASFTPMLGTALLAKATDSRVDAFALQEGASHRSYSARGIADKVLVPQCVLNGIDLRTRGSEPLNNSPFFREERVGVHLKAHRLAREDLKVLIDALTKADFLDEESARRALAAFLRTRERLTDIPHVVDPGPGVLGIAELSSASRDFINASIEGGRRGQAFVAACLDLVFAKVESGGIHDPDARFPGDIVVDDGTGAVLLVAEAKQKPVTESTIIQFAARVAQAEIPRAIYAALAPNQPPLEATQLEDQSLSRHGVLMTVIANPERLLQAAFLWTAVTLEVALREFPTLLARRLVDFGCDPASGEEWARRVESPGPPSQQRLDDSI